MNAHDQTRLVKCHATHLAKQLNALPLGNVTDPRRRSKWELRTLLTAVVTGMAAGCKGLGEMEELTQWLGKGARKALKLPKRVPDTTVRDLLIALNPDDIRQLLYGSVRRAGRGKQLKNDLPVRAASMDGKGTATRLFDKPDAEHRYGQRQGDHAVVRTITTCLVGVPGRPCIDAHPVPAHTNEGGAFVDALDALLGAYGRSLFDVVMYDAAACYTKIGKEVVDRGLDYVFCLTNNQPTLVTEACRQLGHLPLEQADSSTIDIDGSHIVTRHLWMSEEMADWLDWPHLQTVIRVRRVWTTKSGDLVREHDRYYVTSLAASTMTPAQWALLIRRRWSVENENHNVLDTAFKEDDRPWILRPCGMVVVTLLRRLMFTWMTLYRSVTLRAERHRTGSWKSLMRQMERALLLADETIMEGLSPTVAACS